MAAIQGRRGQVSVAAKPGGPPFGSAYPFARVSSIGVLEVSRNPPRSRDLVASFEQRMKHGLDQPKIGSDVRVCQRTFRITSLLGKGSFSSVWSAVDLDGHQEVALKETMCSTQLELTNAEREAKILESISGTAKRSPAVFASETQPTSEGATTVCIAMGKVRGDQLDKIMQRYQRDAAGQTTALQSSMQIDKACNFASDLLGQLVPTFKAISAVALHRDICMENVLVDVGDGSSKPEFSIIDFGLAVELGNWPSLMTQVPVVGCCRYWPVSAWYIFSFGGPTLLVCEGLRQEYESQLDLHALGILALQVFIAMLPPSVPREIAALKDAWEQYWQHASFFWEPMLMAARGEGDWNKVRQIFITNEANRIIERDLGNLRTALNTVRLACAKRDGIKGFTEFASLFTALMELISQGGRAVEFPTWLQIDAIITNGVTFPESVVASSSESESSEPALTFREERSVKLSPLWPDKENLAKLAKKAIRIGVRARLENETSWYTGNLANWQILR